VRSTLREIYNAHGLPLTLNRLYERGLIGDPVNKAKSVILTEKGLRESERLFKQQFVIAGSKTE
jgi:Domain of unknown function (DUF6429)